MEVGGSSGHHSSAADDARESIAHDQEEAKKKKQAEEKAVEKILEEELQQMEAAEGGKEGSGQGGGSSSSTAGKKKVDPQVAAKILSEALHKIADLHSADPSSSSESSSGTSSGNQAGSAQTAQQATFDHALHQIAMQAALDIASGAGHDSGSVSGADGAHDAAKKILTEESSRYLASHHSEAEAGLEDELVDSIAGSGATAKEKAAMRKRLEADPAAGAESVHGASKKEKAAVLAALMENYDHSTNIIGGEFHQALDSYHENMANIQGTKTALDTAVDALNKSKSNLAILNSEDAPLAQREAAVKAVKSDALHVANLHSELQGYITAASNNISTMQACNISNVAIQNEANRSLIVGRGGGLNLNSSTPLGSEVNSTLVGIQHAAVHGTGEASNALYGFKAKKDAMEGLNKRVQHSLQGTDEANAAPSFHWNTRALDSGSMINAVMLAMAHMQTVSSSVGLKYAKLQQEYQHMMTKLQGGVQDAIKGFKTYVDELATDATELSNYSKQSSGPLSAIGDGAKLFTVGGSMAAQAQGESQSDVAQKFGADLGLCSMPGGGDPSGKISTANAKLNMANTSVKSMQTQISAISGTIQGMGTMTQTTASHVNTLTSISQALVNLSGSQGAKIAGGIVA